MAEELGGLQPEQPITSEMQLQRLNVEVCEAAVAESRRTVTTVQEQVRKLEAQIDASELGQQAAHTRELLRQARAVLTGIEDDLRAQAVTLFKLTGDKKLTPFTSVRVEKGVQFVDAQAARDWVLEHKLHGLLKLDEHAIELLVLAGTEVDGVKIVETPKGLIATKLGKE